MSARIFAAVGAHTFMDRPRRPGIRYGAGADKLKLVALALANRTDDGGDDAHPGIRQVAVWAQCTLDTARIVLGHLVADGYAERLTRGGGRHAAVYRLIPERFGISTARGSDPRATLSTPRGSDPRATGALSTTDERATRALPMGQTRALARGSDPRTTSYVHTSARQELDENEDPVPKDRLPMNRVRQLVETGRDETRRPRVIDLAAELEDHAIVKRIVSDATEALEVFERIAARERHPSTIP